MRKVDFMEKLEYLLQDIPDEDKGDALAYYQDYLEEAGPENEETVIREFGSPERIAAIIRADLSGNLEEGGAFTETGYEDERFRDPNYQLAKRLDLPEKKEEKEFESHEGKAHFQEKGQSGGYGSRYGSWKKGNPSKSSTDAGTAKTGRGRREWWQVLGIILIACCLLPVIIPLVFGIGGGAIGLAAGIGGLVAGVLISVTIALAAVTLALLIAGVLMIIFGIGQIANLLQGILYIGTGTGVLGLGFLCLSLCGLYYGKFLPWLTSSLINFISRLIHRKGTSA
ncbi:MAG: DUF1700 domain-containing protein [Lachnospiraceae bacterium]|jgi:hypothetical protein|nr:DUF1700 domain-containing protein [Lachnospiraceae bacterium]